MRNEFRSAQTKFRSVQTKSSSNEVNESCLVRFRRAFFRARTNARMKTLATTGFWLWALLVLASLWGTSERHFVASVPIHGRPTVREASVWARGVAKNAKTVLLERRTSKLGWRG